MYPVTLRITDNSENEYAMLLTQELGVLSKFRLHNDTWLIQLG